MPSPDRCPRCDRAECPWHLLPDPDSDDDRALFSADRARADANCRAHELTIEQWRAEALALRARLVAADRLQAEESERAALLANFVNTIGARIGAREQGYGAQSIEAGEARYRAGIMKRLDELLAAEAIARHLDDAATDEEARECVERLGIDVTTWAAEVRAKVLAALGDNLPTKET